MNSVPAPGGISSLVYNALVRTARRCQKRPWSHRYWSKLWDWSCSRFQGPVQTTMHGRRVVVNFGNSYPVTLRLYPSLNGPIVELVHQAYLAKGAPVVYVDVGTATGDSILQMHACCPGEIGETYGVDGDREFFGYLQQNVGHIRNLKLRFTMLSGAVSDVNELVRVHGGTAVATGTSTAKAVTLDSIALEDGLSPVDVLKVDVDGFDGQILRGAGDILARDRPAVVFEWAPIQCEQTKNSWADPFEAVVPFGYDRFIWFTKFGEFSHFSHGFDPDEVGMLAEFCLKSQSRGDWHYDVVALHAESRISPIELADLMFARGHRSF
jgi:FkbM family methyltransferase